MERERERNRIERGGGRERGGWRGREIVSVCGKECDVERERGREKIREREGERERERAACQTALW